MVHLYQEHKCHDGSIEHAYSLCRMCVESRAHLECQYSPSSRLWTIKLIYKYTENVCTQCTSISTFQTYITTLCTHSTQLEAYSHLSLLFSISYRGWGALGFPILTSSFADSATYNTFPTPMAPGLPPSYLCCPSCMTEDIHAGQVLCTSSIV